MERRRFLGWLRQGLTLGLLARLWPGAARAAQGAAATPPNEASLEPLKRLGAPLSPLGSRSPFEAGVQRYISADLPTPYSGASWTPLEKLSGSVTPSDLHFERHHAGIPSIDPSAYGLLLHGLVERPLFFSLSDLQRFPGSSRSLFIECAGNGQNGYRYSPDPELSAQRSRGLVSGSEWTGLPLATLLAEAGVNPEARWLIAEGMDGAAYTRSIPLAKALDDVFLAYGQNGEALRPAQGYPLRLIVPGWEGSTHVKWLRRLELSSGPVMSRDETAKYSDPMPDGTARLFSWTMKAQSILTQPSGGQQLAGPGFVELRGLAWSGQGRIRKVEISSDGGESWQEARLDAPVLPMALTRFRLPWHWDGGETTLESRAVDESGYVQPSRAQLIAEQGYRHRYHYNAVQRWRIDEAGKVSNGDPQL